MQLKEERMGKPLGRENGDDREKAGRGAGVQGSARDEEEEESAWEGKEATPPLASARPPSRYGRGGRAATPAAQGCGRNR